MMEKITQKDTLTKNKQNKISERLYFEVFYFLVKSEFLFKKNKNKLKYDRFKKITFHTTKTELKETYQMIKLLMKKKRTEEEQKFIEEQLKDIWRVWIVWTVWVLPWWMMIGIILKKLWLKYSVSAYDEFVEQKE